MRVRVLGSAAGGGFPQWNCGCPNCRAVRAGAPNLRARTQESIAVSSDGERWFLLNASPDITRQIESFPPLTPRALRDTPIAGIVLTNGDVDHCLGLFSLRENQPLTLYATDAVRAGIVEGNLLYRTMQRFSEQVTWRALPLDREVSLAGGDGPTLLAATAIAVPGKRPIHLDGIAPPHPGENIGLLLREAAAGPRVAYLPAVAAISPAVAEACAAADLVFLDGTFWSNDELIAQSIGSQRAEEMAHRPVGGPGGTLETLSWLRGRRVFIHVNNTNPILREDSPERAAVERAGWEVAFDGMEIAL